MIRDNLTLDRHNVGMGTMYLGAFTARREYDEDIGQEVLCHHHVSAIRAYWGNLAKTPRPEHGHRQRRLAVKAAAAYLRGADLPGYICGDCGAEGIKLWREYNTCADYTRLLCASCACADQGKPDDVDASGYRGRRRSDQIGWFVPAVPTEDLSTYWGYSSVPEAGVTWWRRLPTRSITPHPKGVDGGMTDVR